MALTKEECVIAWNCIKGLESYPIECTINEAQDKFKTIPFDELFGNEIALIDKLIKEHFDNPPLAKTAKEMFEELGYGIEEGSSCIEVQLADEPPDTDVIIFDLLKKTYEHSRDGWCEEMSSAETSIELHKAIHQQMLELGWIKDEKATPKELAYEGDDCDENGVIIDTAICPICDKHFEIEYDEHAKYCPNCGQVLNWSEVDE